MNNKQPVRFCFGTETAYNNIQNKDPNAIYFVVNNSGGGRIYIGNQLYNVNVVNDLDNASTSDVPSTSAVVAGLCGKVSRCRIITDDTSTSIPAINLEADTEYRYTNIDNDTSNLIVAFPNNCEQYQFYCSVILADVAFSGTVKDFVTLNPASVYQRPIRFLNEDVDLTGKNVVEILFFANGIDICCIGTGYSTST